MLARQRVRGAPLALASRSGIKPVAVNFSKPASLGEKPIHLKKIKADDSMAVGPL
jgi:hypothetical protein